MHTFAVTAMGRSGTAYVARALNSSPTWTVAHEPDGCNDLEGLQPRFQQDHYGEVNSHLRIVFRRLKVTRKAIILRDPYALYRSMVNRHGVNPPIHVREAMRYGLELLDIYASDPEIEVFRFDKLVGFYSNDMYELAEYLGVADMSQLYPCTPINSTPTQRFQHFHDLPHSNQLWARQHLGWFKEKHQL